MQTNGQQVSQRAMDFGKVKLWNNPSFVVQYTNTSGRTQLFLPIRYSSDIAVNAAQQKLAPGETTTLTITYYTEEFGRFSMSVDVYISTQNSPITFEIKGNIFSFHPDAFTACPRFDTSDRQVSREFIHTIKVVDASTKLPLEDFQIEIKTRSSKEVIFSNKSTIQLRREVPGFYVFDIDKENYEPQNTEKYINRSSRETVIELIPEKIFAEKNEEDFDWDKSEENEEVNELDELISSTSSDLDEIKKEEKILKTTWTAEETAKEKSNIENSINDDKSLPADIPVENSTTQEKNENRVNEEIVRNTTEDDKESRSEKPEETKETTAVIVVDTADYDQDGALNEAKFVFNHIVFLLDISSSMKKPDKLPLLKQSMLQMIQVLRPQDKVSMITYGTSSEVLVDALSGANKAELTAVIQALVARGQSYGVDGVDMAYELAKANIIEEGNNEIILASDGVFNSRNFKENKLYRKAMIQKGMYDVRLSTIGFGNTSKALKFLETLADRGDGSFLRITSDVDAESALTENIMKHSVR
jgi:Ca-activated chloride channel family protein